jgi:salicylate synthetase
MDSLQIRFSDSQTAEMLLSSTRENILRYTSPSPSCMAGMPQVTEIPTIPSLPIPRVTVVLPASADRLGETVSLLNKYKRLDYFGYERKDIWYIGLGSLASLRVDPKGEKALIYVQGKERNCTIPGSLTDFARDFVTEQSEHHEGKIFGQVGFNYGAHVRGQKYTPGRWPILSMSKKDISLSYISSSYS